MKKLGIILIIGIITEVVLFILQRNGVIGTHSRHILAHSTSYYLGIIPCGLVAIGTWLTFKGR